LTTATGHQRHTLGCIPAALAVDYGFQELYATETPQFEQGFRLMAVPVCGDLPLRSPGGSRLASEHLMLRWQSLRDTRASASRRIASNLERSESRHAV